MTVQTNPRINQGTLFLVVGPSGAGKDSVIAGARKTLSGDERFAFARRTITRPAAAGGEDHIETTPAECAIQQAAGALCLYWQAHGLHYGISRSCGDDIANRHCVVANVSRSVIDTARRRFPRVRVINVTAPPDVLAERLASRGRESIDDIRLRLKRASENIPGGPDVITLQNAGPLEQAVRIFVSILQLCAFETV